MSVCAFVLSSLSHGLKIKHCIMVVISVRELPHHVGKEQWLIDDVNNNPYHMTDMVSGYCHVESQ